VPSRYARPRIHLTTRGWANDPLGLTFHGGKYHAFQQHIPGKTEWAVNCHWSHATSIDLLSWIERPAALVPGDGDGGCFSGCVVSGPDGTTIFYTSVPEEDYEIGRIRAATPVDASWDSWLKSPQWLFVPMPSDVEVVAFRDPFVWRDETDEEMWRMIVGGGIKGGIGTIFGYSSRDQQTWTYDGVFAQTGARDPFVGRVVLECPQFIEVDGQSVLIASVGDQLGLLHSMYATGDHIDGKFRSDRWRQLTHGSSYYAASCFTDAEGRPGLVHWIRGARSWDDNDPWAGAMSIPHLLSFHCSTLVAAPHPNVARFGQRLTEARIPSGPLASTDAPCDIELELHEGHAPVLIKLRDAANKTSLATLTFHRDAMSVATSTETAQMPLDPEEQSLRLVVDQGIIEVFGCKGAVAAVFAPPDHGQITIDAEAAQDSGLSRVSVSEIRTIGPSKP
jgi:beta-fructofuranosidase